MKIFKKTTRYATMGFIILAGILALVGYVKAGETKESELRNLYMRSGAIEFEQRQLEVEANEIRETLAPLKIQHDQLTSEKEGVNERIQELEGFLVGAVEG